VFPELAAEMNIPEIEGLAHHLDAEAARSLQEAAGDTETDAKVEAPVDTGTLRNSIFTVLFGGKGTMEVNIAAAAASSLKAKRPLVLAALPVPPRNKHEAVISVGVEYGVYVEYGHMAMRSTKAPRKRKGRITETVRGGESPFYEPGVYTLTPGRFYMTKAAENARTDHLPRHLMLAIERAKRKGAR